MTDHAVMFLSQCISFYREFVGPVLSGSLMETVGFQWCATIIAISNAFVVSINIIGIIKCMYM